jgi:hypothetical protein
VVIGEAAIGSNSDHRDDLPQTRMTNKKGGPKAALLFSVDLKGTLAMRVYRRAFVDVALQRRSMPDRSANATDRL